MREAMIVVVAMAGCSLDEIRVRPETTAYIVGTPAATVVVSVCNEERTAVGFRYCGMLVR